MVRPGNPYPAFSLPREQDHFWDWRTRGKRKGGKKKKKKAKMADCTRTLLQKASYRMILGWWRNQSPAFSQALLILLSHLQSHVRTPPTMEKRRGRKKEPGQSVWIGTSSLAASDADRAVASDLCPTPLTKFAQLISAAWHWWTFDLMMSVPHTQHNHDCQQESH